MPDAPAVAATTPAPAAPGAPTKPAAKTEPAKVTPFPVAKKEAAPAPEKKTESSSDAPDGEKGEGEGEDWKSLWKKATKGKTIKHKGAEKQLADFDPEEAIELMRRGYGATELVSATKKTKEEAEQILNLRKAIDEGDDRAALDALMTFGGERGLKLLDGLREKLAEEQAAEEGLTERERAAVAKQREAEQKAAKLEQDERNRQQQEKIAQAKREDAQVRSEGLQKANAVVTELKNFPVEHTEVLLPFVGRAWREAIEAGDELGRDVDPSVIVKRAAALFRESTVGHLGRLSPAQQFDFLGEKAVEKLSAELVKRRRGAPAAVAPLGTPKPKSEPKTEPELGNPRYLLK